MKEFFRRLLHLEKLDVEQKKDIEDETRLKLRVRDRQRQIDDAIKDLRRQAEYLRAQREASE